jgi:hypothetical protein
MVKRRRPRQWPPKGSYPHPDGGHITPTTGSGRIRITGHLKAEPDLKRLAEAIVKHVEGQRQRTRRSDRETINATVSREAQCQIRESRRLRPT